MASGQDGQQPLTFDKTPLVEVLKTLELKRELKFSYDPKLISRYEVSTIVTSGKTEMLMEKILADLPLNFKVIGNIILIIPKRAKKSKLLIGTIIDSVTYQALPFALIRSSENKNTISELDGSFKLPFERNDLSITVSYLGYLPQRLEVQDPFQSIDVALVPDTQVLPEFIVDGYEDYSRVFGVSHFSINPSQINSLPSLGEPDLFKSLQLLPGISATDESSAGLVVRGNSPGQNLVLMDGFTLYHLDHFFGIFSTFNPNVVNHVDVYKGGFSAKYGGRIGAVIDAKGKTGNPKTFKGGVGLNTTSLNAYFETPISEKVNLVFGLRRSHRDILNTGIYDTFLDENRLNNLDRSNLVGPDVQLQPDFSFHDITGKLRWQLGNENFLDFSLYVSADEYSGRVTDGSPGEDGFFDFQDMANWRNNGVSLVWAQNIRENYFSKVTFGYSDYASYSLTQTENTFVGVLSFPELETNDFPIEVDTINQLLSSEQDNALKDLTINWENHIDLTNEQQLVFGAGFSNYETQFSSRWIQNEVDGDSLLNDAKLISAYGQYQISKKYWQIDAGLRYHRYKILDRNDFEPRVNIKVFVSPTITIKTALSHHHQYIHQITSNPFGNSDQFYWNVASEQERPVIFAENFIAGIRYQLNHWTIDLEGYYRQSKGFRESDFIYNFSPEPIPDDALTGQNDSRGFDTFVKYKSDQLTSWLSYSLNYSQNQFATLNQGNSYWSNFDKRNEFNFVTIRKHQNWQFSFVFIYGSGARLTPPLSIDEGNLTVQYDLNAINDFQLPPYHRLDVSAKYQKKLPNVDFELGLSLYNVYNRTNIKSRVFAAYVDGNNGNIPTILPVDIALLGLTPNFFLNFKF